jgi:hypothetical protein
LTLIITEAEAIERFIDGLKKSASRAEEFLTAESKDKARLFIEFIEGIKTAAGSAHSLAHYQMNPKWLDTRDILEGVIAVSQSILAHTDDDKPFWKQIKTALDTLQVTGRTMATSRAMKRSDVLLHLDERAKTLH